MTSIKFDMPTNVSRNNPEKIDTAVLKQSKAQQNAALLQASEKVALQSGNNALGLLYKTALEGINKELEPVFGKNASQQVYNAGIDTSPEATAERIVGFATSLFKIYQQQKPATDQEQQLTDFMAVIGKGINQGFDDAKAILTGLKVFEGEVETGVGKTFELVMQGLQSFQEKMRESFKPAADKNEAEIPPKTAP
ncbi:DUF5610 domain-containing protein [Alishewanella sp. d11]|uniref:DUF5610 domain-containing protein n=1 Tax=Alishewanella sp. d11 TaxID=3414030 RepID=UPI003BF82F5C